MLLSIMKFNMLNKNIEHTYMLQNNMYILHQLRTKTLRFLKLTKGKGKKVNKKDKMGREKK